MLEHNNEIVHYAMRNGKQVIGMKDGKLVHATFLVDYPALAPMLIDYPALAPMLIDYPALAPMLIEDNDIVHSLVDTGYDRYIIGDGNSYIVTRHAIGVHPRIVIEGYYCTLVNACIFQPIYNGVLKQDGWVTNPDGNMYYRYGASSWNGTRGMGTITGQRMNLDLSDRMIRDGVEYGSPITGYNFANYKDYKMRLWGAGWSGSRTIEMSRVKMYDDEVQYLDLVPFNNNGLIGMVDLLTGKFYANQGTGQFTIKLTPKV